MNSPLPFRTVDFSIFLLFISLQSHHLFHCTLLRMQLRGKVLLFAITITVSVLLSSSLSVRAAAIYRNDSSGSPLSPWLEKVANHHGHAHGHDHGYDPRDPGCRRRPWICRRSGGRGFPPRKRCCRNRCIDVSSDVNNCGWCGRRCPFAWKCCRGFCRNVSISFFNCGRCGNRCPFGQPCFFGICGYAHPHPPKPPKPPRPPRPFPPRPPKKGPKGKRKRRGKPPRGSQPPGTDESSFIE